MLNINLSNGSTTLPRAVVMSNGYRIGKFGLSKYIYTININNIELSLYRIERVLPCTPWHPCVFFAGTEQKL